MNIKDFLIENYIWILAIILITIITIIGFLADKKKNEKKKVNQTPQQNMNNQPVNNQMPIQYQQTPVDLQQNQMNNNMGFNYNNNLTINPVNQTSTAVNNMPSVGTEPQALPMMSNSTISMNNSTQVVDSIFNNVIPEPIYQPLSEQNTIIQPQMGQNFNGISNVDNQETQEFNNPYMVGNQQSSGNIQNGEYSTNSTTQQTVVLPPQMGASPLQYNQPVYNVPNQVPPTENNNQMMTPNFISNVTPSPEPVNPIPQPVIPQPIMQEQMTQQQMYSSMSNYNTASPTQPNIANQIQGQNANQLSQPTVSTPQPINFVYGPQNNNNQNM